MNEGNTFPSSAGKRPVAIGLRTEGQLSLSSTQSRPERVPDPDKSDSEHDTIENRDDVIDLVVENKKAGERDGLGWENLR